MVTLQQIRDAQGVIAGRLVRTPTVPFRPLAALPEIYFKLELFQRTGSFKVRGVVNALSHLSDQQRQRGVISMSSGNHAQALAYGASLHGISATIVMPAWSDSGKVAATRKLGGEVLLAEENFVQLCDQLAEERGLQMIHPFDDPSIIAGAGTLGLEIQEECPDPDVVLVSVGGGGLISGVAAAVKQSSPGARVIGVEPAGANVMTKSLEKGSPVSMKVDTVADGLAAPFAGVHTLEHVRRFVDEMITVTDDEIIAALRLLVQDCKLVVEPAAATAFAPLMTGQVQLRSDQRAVCVICGGNISASCLKSFL